MIPRRGLQSPNEALQPEPAPLPPPRRRRRQGLLAGISGFLSFLLVACVASALALVAGYKRMQEPGPLSTDKVMFIAPGTDVPEIIAQLEREGVIDSPLMMHAVLTIEGNRSKLKFGEYLFHQHASLRDVMDTVVNGRQVLHAITIPEGLTSDQVVQRLRDSDVLAGDMREPPKEGTLLPETYKIQRGYSRSDLIRKMQDEQRKLLDQIWARRSPDLPIRTPYELVTLASIVEKETGKADERPHVASVFVNRLNKRMRLQSDPTIVYGLVGGKGTLGRGILRSEVDKPTPYNTYTIDGLPPGPIANPGRAALEAVANPSRTQDLYFVADGTGGHVFAETLAQHSANVARWRQIEKDKAAAEVDRAAPLAPDQPGTPNTSSAPAGRPQPGPVGQQPAPKPGQRGALGDDLRNFGALLPFGSAPPLVNEARLDYAPALLPRLIAPEKLLGALQEAAATSLENALAASLMHPQEERPQVGQGALAAVTGQVKPIGEPQQAAAMTSAPPLAYAMSPGLEERGIKVRGVNAGNDILDGPMADVGDELVDPAIVPVSAERRAEQRARAAQLGLAPGSDKLPRDMGMGAPKFPVKHAAMLPSGRAVALDASEGTPIDPLKDKSWDLNSAKVVASPEGEPAPEPRKRGKAPSADR
ncbi:MAG: hypothetical protein QOH65_1606 [Methylobacteriaceae bacterium]|nr:hypothetical protein [Methylobacteriaceae bacterium]